MKAVTFLWLCCRYVLWIFAYSHNSTWAILMKQLTWPGHANISWTQRLLATMNETNLSQALILKIRRDNFRSSSRLT